MHTVAKCFEHAVGCVVFSAFDNVGICFFCDAQSECCASDDTDAPLVPSYKRKDYSEPVNQSFQSNVSAVPLCGCTIA